MKKILNRFLPPLAWMGGIFILSAQSQLPQAPDPLLNILLKKLAHALAYGILAWLYLRGLAPKGGSDRLRLLALVLAVAYAASDEFHQSFVPGRHPSLVDVSIDGVGAMTALLLQRRWRVLAAAAQS
jgi:VanZ family protein